MAILVPALDPKTGKPMLGKVKLLDEFKKTGQSTENLVALVNKAPGVWQCRPCQPVLLRAVPFTYTVRWTAQLRTVWDAAKNMYILDFRGRVTQASIRNFQAVRAENGASCCLLPDAGLQFLAHHPIRRSYVLLEQQLTCVAGVLQTTTPVMPTCTEEEIVIQFGKVGDNSYTLDFAHPVSAFQAFAVSLTAFEG